MGLCVVVPYCTNAAVWLCLFGAGVLGDGLGALAHGVLGQLAGQEETHGGLDLAARDGRAAVVVGELGGLVGDALEDVVDERVHDAHGLARDARVRMHLLEHLVDVDGVGLLSSLLALALASLGSLRRLYCLLRSLRWRLWRHVLFCFLCCCCCCCLLCVVCIVVMCVYAYMLWLK